MTGMRTQIAMLDRLSDRTHRVISAVWCAERQAREEQVLNMRAR